MTNIFSVDVEEYFCANNLRSFAPRHSWDTLPSRIQVSVERILDLLAAVRCEATFFVLGWVAERMPALVERIEGQGHEVATHGYEHRLLTEMEPRSFENDLQRALEVTGSTLKQKIIGYRAPSFTLTPKTTWAYGIMERHGIRYDSSVFPITFHPDYGFSGASLDVHHVTAAMTEVPISCIDFAGKRVPCTGGGYFRLLPYFFTRILFKRCNTIGRPVVFYLHPWELDPEQPQYPLPRLKRLRHYSNLRSTEKKLRMLLHDFSFTSIRKALSL